MATSDRLEHLFIEEGLSVQACGRALGIGLAAATEGLLRMGLQVGWRASVELELDPTEALRQEEAGQINPKHAGQREAKARYSRPLDWTDRPVESIAITTKGKRK